MREELSRLERLIGGAALEKLASSRVAVFGVGGVGGHAFESLVRSGIGEIDIIDGDIVAESNINRQIIATRETIGRTKVDVAEERAKSINPDVLIRKYPIFYLPEKKEEFGLEFDKFGYIVDAIDTVSAKLDIIEEATRRGIPIISAMGCGNRLDPSKLVVTDIFKTFNDPLAKVMRKNLKERGIKKLKVVASTEVPRVPNNAMPEELKEICEVAASEDVKTHGKPESRAPGSTAFVPGAAGLIIASVVVRELIENA
ncbi:MAG: tRNA threonylcarbamoyladenosine dehydratase [Firmicutes bacterium]|nr:tRNA threonylcarbamoyladenosine dehydratase [Bacillota bacterium]